MDGKGGMPRARGRDAREGLGMELGLVIYKM